MEKYLILCGCLFPMAIWLRSGHFFRVMIFTALTGLGSLAAVCWLGAYTGVLLTFNPFTAGVSCFMGVPGVLAILALRLMFVL